MEQKRDEADMRRATDRGLRRRRLNVAFPPLPLVVRHLGFGRIVVQK